jgi:hypothetical protein
MENGRPCMRRSLHTKKHCADDALTTVRRGFEMNSFTKWLSMVSAGLGSCAVCVRKAFHAAAIAWCLTLSLWLMGVAAHWQLFALVVASGITLLWASHLFAYSLKSLKAPCANGKVGSSPETTRREVIRRFANAFTFIAASTSLPAFSRNCSDSCSADMKGNSGWGGCGEACRFKDGRTMTCGPCQRPVYTRDGGCSCCGFAACG